MRCNLVLVFSLFQASCRSFFVRPAQINKANDTNQQKHSNQPEQIQLPQEQTKRKDLPKEVLLQQVKLDIKDKEDSKKKSPQPRDNMFDIKTRKSEVGVSEEVGFQERESETPFHRIISKILHEKKGESKAKVLRAQKESSSSKAVELTMKPPASYLISTVRVTKLSSRNSSSTNLLYSLYLGLPAALLFLLLVILLAAYFYRPNSDNVQVHHLAFYYVDKVFLDLTLQTL